MKEFIDIPYQEKRLSLTHPLNVKKKEFFLSDYRWPS
jgi:hypothetical protein